jgi:hypothetical protein
MLTAAFSSAKVVSTAVPRTQAIWRALTSSMLTFHATSYHRTAHFQAADVLWQANAVQTLGLPGGWQLTLEAAD